MSNLEKIRARIPANADALLVTEIVNVGWLTGFSGSAGKAIVTRNDARFITDSRYTLQANEQVSGMPVFSFQSPVLDSDFVLQNLNELGVKSLALDPTTITYDAWHEYEQKWNGIQLLPAKDAFSGLRMIKSADEIEKLEAACNLADACFDHVLRLIQPGVAELDISIEIEFFFKRQGAGIAFAPIVVSGERSARPHGVPSEKKLEIGDFVTMDFGAILNGYNSDITRTVVVGEASDRHRAHYAAVLESQMAVLEQMKPGMTGAQVDAIARDILGKHQLAEYFGHGLGHGLGRLVHDTGRLSPTSTDTIEVGQVWTIEPGAYVPGFGGVRIEDDVVVEENGVRRLTHSTKELLVLPNV